jgi:FlaA1/EpsC-like NDP-sugar epimerase
VRRSRRFNPRVALAMAHDVAASGVAWAAAFWLRLNLELPSEFAAAMLQTLPLVVGVQTLFFWRFGLYRGIWRYASLHDLRLIALTLTVTAPAVPALLVLLRLTALVPRSVFLLDPLLLLLMMGGSRMAYRAWKEGRVAGLAKAQAAPVLILGAGDAADALIRELSAKRDWRPWGCSTTPRKQGARSMA